MIEGLIPISARTLIPELPVGIDIFLRHVSERESHLLLASTQSLTADAHQRLVDREELRLFIRKSERDTYQAYLRDNLDDWMVSDSLPATAKTAALSEVVRGVLDQAFQLGDTSKIFSVAVDCGERMAGWGRHPRLSANELTRILHHDYGTFTHSANVAFYATLLASRLGFSPSEIKEISMGGMLHDLGKLDIDERILNKPGRLEEHEFRIVKTHSLLGYRRLCNQPGVTELQLMMAYQHHERIDGRGYPVGILGEAIHDAARLCSVVDVYEALTSERPYRQPMPPKSALELMERDCGKAFDPEYFQCWKALINERTDS